MAEPAIRLRKVHLTLGSGASSVHVLKGIDLEVARGESVGIVGPSGSGKSTLLMVLAGLERPDEGEVEIAGQSLIGLSEDRLAAFRGRNVGIVFQSFHLIPNMTALENVAVPLELAGADAPFERARTELENVGLGDRATHYPGELSGGEQQRVALARALAPQPAILIADEPTGNLDQTTGRQVADRHLCRSGVGKACPKTSQRLVRGTVIAPLPPGGIIIAGVQCGIIAFDDIGGRFHAFWIRTAAGHRLSLSVKQRATAGDFILHDGATIGDVAWRPGSGRHIAAGLCQSLCRRRTDVCRTG